MPFFAWPYRVLYHDTMALGWHHFLTNFKFQCEAREHYLYRHMLVTPEALRESADIAPVTHEGYSRNLAPVKLGEKVGILMSFEDATPSSVYFCFRVVRHDGVPVACGFQRLVSASQSTGAIVGSPESLRHHAFLLREKLIAPNFRERVVAGTGMEQVFDEEVIRLGRQVALEEREGPLPAPPPLVADGTKRVVFLFPGTGAFQPELLAEVARVDAGVAARLQRAGDIVEPLLGVSLKPLVSGGNEAEYLRAWPELVHVGVYLAGTLAGGMLLERGARPALMAGHSVGEIAALVTAGAFSFETGVEMIARRILALRAVKGQGSMLALPCTPKRARTMIECLGRSTLGVAVVNLPDLCVVSGTHADLERLARLAQHLSIATLRVGSDVPFHSRLLEECVEPWRQALRRLPLGEPRIPVFSPMERGWYGPQTDFCALLPSHFVRPLLFHQALTDIHAVGGETFIECGGGRTLTGLVGKAFPDGSGVRAAPVFHPSGSFGKSLEHALDLCGAGGARRGEPRGPAPKMAAVSAPRVAPPVKAARPALPLEPIAVVGMGCIVPGAFDPAALWKKVLDGTTELGPLLPDPDDFTGSRESRPQGTVPAPDKTYSRMCGAIRGFVPDAATPEFPTSSQRFLAAALEQCLAELPGGLPDPARMQLLLGSTGDGVREYDDALLIAGLTGAVRSAGVDAQVSERLCAALETSLGMHVAGDLSPWPLYRAVADRMLGLGVQVLAMDAACASSLYAIGHAVRRLRRGDCDLVFAGGVFTPGPANSCLFAQFGGLSPTGSRPFDATADGVVFSEGAGVLALKRLSDAVAANDTIHAVIRGVAFSSDGKSPSVMEPREPGQLLAMRRAYAATGVDPAAIQFLEAHATATPVGDGVEVRSASKVFQGTGDKIALGSVKSVFGHTGWAAGAISAIKVIQGFAAGLLPSQTAFDQPNPRLELEGSRFEILKAPKPWPKRDGEPRRAAVNGFGFGGSNAHLVLESYEPAYHGALPKGVTSAPGRAPPTVAIVACSPVFPAQWPAFRSDELSLPPSVIILPDVQDHMDRTQVLGIVAASGALAGLPGWQTLAEETGVALGIEGKTGRGVRATARVFRDHVARRTTEANALTEAEARTLREVVDADMERIVPSGPYTLPGLMPNVAAGRLANAFNLKGPNLVLDSGRTSLRSALALAADWIESGECELVLAGGVHGAADPAIEALIHAGVAEPEARAVGEGGLLLAITSQATAQKQGWPVLALMRAREKADGLPAGQLALRNPCLMGAEGALEVVEALASVKEGAPTADIAWRDGTAMRFSLPEQAAAQAATEELLAYAVDMVELPGVTGDPGWLGGKRILVLCSESPNPACLAMLDGLDYRLVVPAGVEVEGAIVFDLSDDATLARSVAALDAWPCDVMLALRDLRGLAPESVTEGGDKLIELAFAACRHLYGRLADRTVAFAGLSLNAWLDLGPSLHPATGLLGGFARSIASELPGSLVKVLHADGADPGELRGWLAQELSAGSAQPPAEIACREGRRFAMRPRPLAPCVSGAALLDADSVVLALGGARGVTAVLVEALLERFGCTVVILGRSRPDSVPAAYVAMDEAKFAACETGFYDDYLARRPGTRPAEMKRAWKSLAAAHEAGRTLARLKTLRGRVSFIEADVTDAAAVDAAVEQVARAHGRIDMVLYGAGVQTSRLLSRRTLAELREVLRTKLTGIGNVERACTRHVRGDPPHFHVLGSAAGVLGNAGQADYAAANEALSRLAACRSLDASHGAWTTVAWLGWRETGMGADYSGLAQVDGSAWLTREEGKAFFLRLMAGSPAVPQIGMLRSGSRFPGVDLSSEKPAFRVLERNWIVSLEVQPFLAYHKVDGVPTVPGAYSIDMGMRAAAELRPGLRVTRMENVQLNRFVKVFAPRETVLRGVARLVFEDEHESFVHISFTTDFVHASGRTLRRNVRVMSGLVVLAGCVTGPAPLAVTESTSVRQPFPQPYRNPLSRVRVDGPFDGLSGILVGEDLVTASFHVPHPDPVHAFSGSIVPVVALDALFRISGYDAHSRDAMPIFAPTHFASIELPETPIGPGDKLMLRTGQRHFKVDSVTIDWAEILDGSGTTRLRVAGMRGQKMGDVPLLEEETDEMNDEAMEPER